MNFQNKLIKMDACNDAVKYCQGYKTLSSAWDVCERGDWMLWLVGKLSGPTESPSRKKLVLCACECARLSLKYVKEGELRSLKAIETAEKWARGEDGKSLQEVKNAASAAAAADAAAAAAAVIVTFGDVTNHSSYLVLLLHDHLGEPDSLIDCLPMSWTQSHGTKRSSS